MDSKKMNNNTIAIVGASEAEPHPDSPSLGKSVVFSLDTDSDTFDYVTSSYSSPDFADTPPADNDPVLDVSDLFLQLPIISGLSKYYQGKSRTFTSLANVRSLQDLAKPEHPYNKKIKLMASRGEDDAEASLGDTNRRGISMSSRASCPSINVEMSNPDPGITSRPQVSPRTSTTTSITKKTPLDD